MTQPPALASGVIVACVGDSGPRYLMLRNAEHKSWGVPKGHAEPGESAMQAALRETREETGIHLDDVHPGFEHSFEYDVNTARGAYRKRVVYYLATVPDAAPEQSPEHDASGWYDIDEACRLAKYPDMQDALRKAHAALLTRDGS
jgi:8-oxo-dGTP pyrophosphatase MutT (NUDIX family)